TSWRCAAAAATRGAAPAERSARGPGSAPPTTRVQGRYDTRRTSQAARGTERVFKADTITVEILKRCTGVSTLDEIVDDLAKAFTAPRERIHADVVNLLGALADKKLLEV